MKPYIVGGKTRYATLEDALKRASHLYRTKGVIASVEHRPAKARRKPVAERVIGKGDTRIRVMPDGTLRFKYRMDMHGGGTFECSLFCEIGEPYKARFRALMDEVGLRLGEVKELDQRPWVADTKGDSYE